MKTVAYLLYQHDNDGYMFVDGHPFSCSQCNVQLINAYNPKMTFKKKNFDISSTYDNYTIVSKRFVEYVIHSGYKNLSFLPLLKDDKFFYFDLSSLPTLKEDDSSSELEMEDRCDLCGYIPTFGYLSYEFQNSKQEIKRGFFRSERRLGRTKANSFNLIIGIDTYKEIELEKFSGRDIHALKA